MLASFYTAILLTDVLFNGSVSQVPKNSKKKLNQHNGKINMKTLRQFSTAVTCRMNAKCM